MRSFEKINFLIATLGKLVIALFRPRLWPPFLIYLAITLILVFALVSMFSSFFSGLMIPLVVFVSSTRALHFPDHLALLPFIFERLNWAPSLLLESLLTTAAILMFASYFRREKVDFRSSLKTAARFYPKLLLVWIIDFLLIYLLFLFLPRLFSDFASGSPRRQMALSVGLQGLQILLSSLFIYVVPVLVIAKKSLLSSFTTSFKLFFRNFFTTYFILGIPQLVMLPLVLALQNSASIVQKFNPQLMVMLTVLLACMMTLRSFFVYGSVVRFYLEVSEE